MRTIHIGMEKMDMPQIGETKRELFHSVKTVDLAVSIKNTSTELFDLILVSEDIWKDGPDEVLPKLKNELLNDYGVLLPILDAEVSSKVDLLYHAGAEDYMVLPVTKTKILFSLGVKANQAAESKRVAELMKEIMDLQQANEQLKSIADLDALTGIYNRRYFHSYLSSKWKEAIHPPQRKLSVIMADIDSFKSFNDTYGHIKGDECIREVAKRLKQSARKMGGLAARYGGEEFVIILEDRPDKDVEILAEEIRSTVENLKIKIDGGLEQGVTISLGAASLFIKEGNSYLDLMNEADRRLYEAKSFGGNRVQTAEAS
ncbi:GGDEF domain-containing protein [Metabacillus sp. 113a]|uniref:GGDEF domain-containing protein n=1 Tax=Metabacillus sp. 113a TaxID=3404706 RepID=UPI003CEC26BC